MRLILADAPRSAGRAGLSEAEFYTLYEWCLNPILSVRELFHRLDEELARYDERGAGWQRDERRINLYLFICAIACTVDDYLAWRPWTLAPIVARFPRLRGGAGVAQALLNLPSSAHTLIGDRSIARWRREWERCVDQVCDMLVRHEIGNTHDEADTQRWRALQTTVGALATTALPPRLLQQRMRLPEGFRCQDLTHHDVITMARRFAESQRQRESPLLIIGPRTAGAYFAPLIKAYLQAQGWPRVSWMTLRPKMGISRREWGTLRRATREDVRVLLVDDYPNSGRTLRLLLDVLKQLRIPPHRIAVAAPRHSAEADRPLLDGAEGADAVTIVRLEPHELHKAHLLDGDAAETRLREYYGDWDTLRVHDSARVTAINAHLWGQYRDGFQVRLKRLYRVHLSGENGQSADRHLFAKSVGWGWLGYHAYISGARLAGLVPQVIGLRDGLLLTEWLDGPGDGQADPPRAPSVHALSSYVATRVQRLRLTEDPCFGSSGYRWTGWDEMVTILRRAYGPYVGRLKVRALRERLGRYVSPVPTLVDGRMRPGEWIQTPAGIYKVDFEHHNFGGGEMDIVDPAWDLAAAIFEFSLSAQEEQDLLHAYARDSGDRTIADRVLLYALLYGTHVMSSVEYAMAREHGSAEQERWNQRYLLARNFLTYQMNRSLAGPARSPRTATWSRRLFFLDLDGVFDCERLGFPHTTPSGLDALTLLRSNDVSIVLNTGRSVEHVREYCEVYGLPGGIAEYGSVFIDAVAGREMPLVGPEAAEQLARLREAISGIPGLSVDNGYRHSVRVYRWRGSRTVGLTAGEVDELLTRCRCDSLTAVRRGEDTYLVQRGISKGAALRAVRAYLNCTHEPAIAMGDSDQDLDALEAADLSYAPANCSRAVRALARRGRCRVMPQSFQRGLLAAARDLLSCEHPTARPAPQPTRGGESDDLMRALVRVADRSRLRQWVAACDWRGL